MHFDVSKTVGSVLYFREHAMLAKTAGVKHLVVLVNKMDDPTVEWDQGRLVSSGTNNGLSISYQEMHFLCVSFEYQKYSSWGIGKSYIKRMVVVSGTVMLIYSLRFKLWF